MAGNIRRTQETLVVLDAMGVIYASRDDVAELLIPYARSFGCTLSNREIEDLYLDCSLGKFSSLSLWQSLGACGDLRILEDDYLNCHRLSEGLTDFLDAMDDRNLPLACLSNDVAEWSLSLRRRFGLNQRLTHWTISGDVGARKPDPAIYQHLLSATARRPEECIFIDDRIRNIDIARDMGFKTVLFAHEPDDANQHRRVSSFEELKQYVVSLASGKMTPCSE
jgi:putative hydrolase of the HAD superfamily